MILIILLFLQAKKYKKYLDEKKDISVLTEEDRLLLELNKINNLPNKLNILQYIGSFKENVQFIGPVSVNCPLV